MKWLPWALFMAALLAPSPGRGQEVHDDHRPPPGDAPRAELQIPAEQQRRMGLQVTRAVRASQRMELRTAGFAAADDSREVRVHTQLSGWVREIHAARTGDPIARGEVLFHLYSPEILATQQEYVSARNAGEVGKEIAEAALRRLRLWGVAEGEIRRLQQTGEAGESVGIVSPADGVILERNVAQGSYVTPGAELYRIVDLSTLWVMVTLYEHDLPLVEKGDAVSLVVPGRAEVLTGTFDYIYPQIDPETRSASARVVVPNPTLRLLPGMYVEIFLQKALEEAVLIPENAIIRTGVRDLVFVRHGEAHFEPREIRLGRREGEMRAIIQGLAAGEMVVLRPLFLIDSESRLQAAIEAGAPAVPEHGH
jgi:membrane fusion protein, copper/silver efflux system